ncbi:MAG TPA: phage holin family protein [Chloroflexia bacterium]|jgi:putative membrane protein|nr:phage holin family protein [Chloroflexia bacterium]
MTGILVRWAITIIAVFVAAKLLPTMINYDDWVGLAIFAAVLGLVNAIVKPIVAMLSLPLVLLTLGLFLLVINALMFWLAASLVPGFYVNGFLGALVGSIIVSLVSWVLSALLPN